VLTTVKGKPARNAPVAVATLDSRCARRPKERQVGSEGWPFDLTEGCELSEMRGPAGASLRPRALRPWNPPLPPPERAANAVEWGNSPRRCCWRRLGRDAGRLWRAVWLRYCAGIKESPKLAAAKRAAVVVGAITPQC